MFRSLARWLTTVGFTLFLTIGLGCSSGGLVSPVAKTPTSARGTAVGPTLTAPTRVLSSATAFPSHGGPVRDHVSFVDTLRARGYTVEILDSVEQPFFRGVGTLLHVQGENLATPIVLQSFNYHQDDVKMDPLRAAKEDAEQIEASGQPRRMRIEWVAPPHFYRRERVTVLYLGNDAPALALLEELLGPQFAGE